MDALALFLVASGTALATGLGALPVYALRGDLNRFTPALWGLAAGLMTVASALLVISAERRGGLDSALIGAAIGAAALLAARWAIGDREAHLGTLRDADARRGLLVIGVLTAHSLPEGLAIGAAWGAPGEGDVALVVVLALALQNVPEGTVSAIPMREAGLSLRRAFWLATATSAAQPLGALAAYGLVRLADPVVGVSLGLAAGAMTALVLREVIPAASGRPLPALGAAIAGGGALAALAVGLGVE